MDEADIQAKFVDVYLHIFKYMGDLVSITSKPYHITFEAFLVMELIADSKEPVTLVKVAEMQNVSRSAIARQINNLLSLNYISQTNDSHDRRLKYLALTAEGAKVEAAVRADADDRFHQWLQVYGQKRASDTLRYIQEANDKAEKLGFSGFGYLHDKRETGVGYSDPHAQK